MTQIAHIRPVLCARMGGRLWSSCNGLIDPQGRWPAPVLTLSLSPFLAVAL